MVTRRNRIFHKSRESKLDTVEFILQEQEDVESSSK